MQNYGGTLTWVAYDPTVGVEIIVPIPEGETETVEAVTVEAPKTVETSVETTQQERETTETEKPATRAIYGGEYTTAKENNYTMKTASFSNLVAGEEYVLLVLESLIADDPLSADNVLYIGQKEAEAGGSPVFTYAQREDPEICYAFICGASNMNLKDAVITFPEMTATGKLTVISPTVTYNDEVLTEGQDYVLVGTVSYIEAGTYTRCRLPLPVWIAPCMRYTLTPIIPERLRALHGIELSELVYADARQLVTVHIYLADGTLYSGAKDCIESYIHRSGTTNQLFDMLMRFTDSAKVYLD